MRDPNSVCVVIPALNESLRIREVVQGALAHCPNVIVIDVRPWLELERM